MTKHHNRDLWIGDGACDDLCRTPECGYDGGDCEIGCIADDCSTIYQFFLFLAGSDSDALKMNHTIACRDKWQIAIDLLGVDDTENCEEELDAVDYNQDGFINFRFVLILIYLQKTKNNNDDAQNIGSLYLSRINYLVHL